MKLCRAPAISISKMRPTTFSQSKAPYIAVCDEAGNEVLRQPIHLTNGEHSSGP